MIQDYGLGPYVPHTALAGHYSLLRRVLSQLPAGMAPGAIALEFGVGNGQSTRLIAGYMPVIGFDSFEGLPEDWRDGFPRGSFAVDEPPRIDNATYRVGLFEDTLPAFSFEGLRTIGLVHVDCDLYSSTVTVLDHLGRNLHCLRGLSGCYVVFDEWHGYEGAEAYEQRAWREFADRTGIHWTVIGHSVEQWGIRICPR